MKSGFNFDSVHSTPGFPDIRLPQAIHKEEFIVREIPPHLIGDQIRRVLQSTEDRNGEIVRTTTVEQIKLTCGCMNQTPAARCVCGSVVLCAAHQRMVNIHCSRCMRFIAQCCGKGVKGVVESFICLECYYAMSGWQRFKYDWKYGV